MQAIGIAKHQIPPALMALPNGLSDANLTVVLPAPSTSGPSADVGPSAKRRKVETPPKVIKIPKERYLSLGSQAFSSMREEGLMYIDKTGSIANLLCDKKISKGSTSLFFFRPRKFGKSLVPSPHLIGVDFDDNLMYNWFQHHQNSH
jgi:hypothetical protein